MLSFEQAFSDTERAAESAIKSAGDLARHARALKKAAQEGNITSLKRAQRGIEETLDALGQDAGSASSTWPFQEEEERNYLSTTSTQKNSAMLLRKWGWTFSSVTAT